MTFGYLLIAIGLVGLIIATVAWIANDPSYEVPAMPDGWRERLEWQAKYRASNWAKTVLILDDERNLLMNMVLAYEALEKRSVFTANREEHEALSKAQDEYHNFVARTYNKEEC